MPTSGIRIPQEHDLYALIEQWRDSFPGAQGRAQFGIHTVVPPEFEKITLAPGDDGYAAGRQLEAGHKAILVVYGPKIYPPLRYALIKLAQDPPPNGFGSFYGLGYEKGVSALGDRYISKPGKHFSRITGKTLSLLYGALEKRMQENAVENQVLGYVGQMYSALVTPEMQNSTYNFSDYTFVPSEDGPLLQGNDGSAVNALAAQLNKAFGKEAGWQPLEPGPVATIIRKNAIAESHTLSFRERMVPHNDPRNQFTLPVGFFRDAAMMAKLKALAAQVMAQPPYRPATDRSRS